jgi:hypothetical protein
MVTNNRYDAIKKIIVQEINTVLKKQTMQDLLSIYEEQIVGIGGANLGKAFMLQPVRDPRQRL